MTNRNLFLLESSYKVFVDYEISTVEAVKRGKYDWTLDVIAYECSQIRREGREHVTIELLRSMGQDSTDSILKGLNNIGMRPADLLELLALGEQFPDLQREFPIVALGSSWEEPKGIYNSPYLIGALAERRLNIYATNSTWERSWRYAAVRRSTKA